MLKMVLLQLPRPSALTCYSGGLLVERSGGLLQNRSSLYLFDPGLRLFATSSTRLFLRGPRGEHHGSIAVGPTDTRAHGRPRRLPKGDLRAPKTTRGRDEVRGDATRDLNFSHHPITKNQAKKRTSGPARGKIRHFHNASAQQYHARFYPRSVHPTKCAQCCDWR